MDAVGKTRDEDAQPTANPAREARTGSDIEPTPDERAQTLLTPSDNGSAISAATTNGSEPAPAEAVSQPDGLPAVLPTADLSPVTASRRTQAFAMAICLVLTFGVYVSLIPHFLRFANPPTGDQPFYLMDTISLVQDGDLNVANNYQQGDFDQFYKLKPPDFAGMTAPYPLPAMLANTVRPQPEAYSFHLPGLSLLMAPAWWIGSHIPLWEATAAWPATIVLMCLFGALVSLNVFLLAWEITGRQWIAWAVWLPVAFSGPIMTYSYLLFTEMTVGLFLIYSFRRLALGWGANGTARRVFLGFTIGFIPWLAWRCLPIALALVAYAAVQWWRYTRAESPQPAGEKQRRFDVATVRRGLPSALPTLVPLVISGALLLWYNLFLFGRPAPDSSTLEQGRIAIFYWPWGGPDDLTKFVTGAFGLLFDQKFGLLPYSPVYLLAAIGMIAMFYVGRRSDRRLLLWMAIIALPYMGVVTSFYAWSGVWCPPARYLATFVPLMAAPLGMALYAFSGSIISKVLFGIVYWVAAAWGVFTTALMFNDPRLMWPVSEYPIFKWLVIEQDKLPRIDVRPFLADFVDPDELTHPQHSAILIGFALFVVLVGSIALMNQRTAQGRRHWALPAQSATWLGAIVIVGLGWFDMSHEYMQRKTILTMQHRWDITNPHLGEAYGIAYHDNKVYLTSFGRDGRGMVIEYDLATEQPTIIMPHDAGGPLQFLHPSDVKFGSDGLMYVLNNGPDGDALWAMRPDGEVVNKIRLNEKTPIATGMFLDGKGGIFIADMLGGTVLNFPSKGGQAATIYRSDKGGFNNPAGVAVGADGHVYAAELGFGMMHELTMDGKPVRKYDLKCRPIHAVASGDWVDISCDRGMVSINTQTHEIQRSRFDPTVSKPDNPTGIAYGPDNTLFLLGSDVLYQYKLER